LVFEPQVVAIEVGGFWRLPQKVRRGFAPEFFTVAKHLRMTRARQGDFASELPQPPKLQVRSSGLHLTPPSVFVGRRRASDSVILSPSSNRDSCQSEHRVPPATQPTV